MTDATRLALARAVYPSKQWYSLGDEVCHDGFINVEKFDPDNNSDQAWAVLA